MGREPKTVMITEEQYREYMFYKKTVIEALTSYFVAHRIAEKTKREIESLTCTKTPGETCSGDEEKTH